MVLSNKIHLYKEVLGLKVFDTSTEHGRSKERYRLIALSGIMGLVAKLVTAVLGLVSVPLTIHYLGKEQFGLWMVINSLVVWMQLADFGIGNGLINALAEANGRNDRKAACGYVSSTLAASSAVTVLGFIPVYLFSIWLPWDIILNLPKGELASIASQCFFVSGLVFVVNVPLSVASRVFIAYQNGYRASLTQVVSALASLACLMAAIMLKLDIVWLVLLVSSGPVVGNLFAWFMLIRILPWLRISWSTITRPAIRRIANSSVPLFLFQIGALIINQLVNVVIAQVGTLRMVADYNVILKIYLLIFAMGISFSAPFYPAIREAYEKHDAGWVFRALRRVLFIRTGIIFIASMCLLFTGDLIIRMWLNLSLESNFGYLGWFSFLLSLVFASASSTLGEILTSLDDIWSQIKIVFISAVVVITSMYLLIPSIGLAGVFFAMALSTIYAILWSWRRLHMKLQERFT
jgi:O-antigen/teichoic acid export membrane protein